MPYKICPDCGKSRFVSLFRVRCRECENRRAREYRKKRPRTYFQIALKRDYGITLKKFDKMLIEQAGRCAICLTPMMRPHVDHNHRTKEVRGLLCKSCNTGLGNFCDSPELLKHAIDYLEKSNASKVG